MSGLELLVALTGLGVTVLVVAAMILITPRGQVDLHDDENDPQGSDLSRAQAPNRPAPPPRARSDVQHHGRR